MVNLTLRPKDNFINCPTILLYKERKVKFSYGSRSSVVFVVVVFHNPNIFKSTLFTTEPLGKPLERQEIELIIDHAHMVRPPLKSSMWQGWGASRFMNTRCQEGDCLGEGMEACVHTHTPFLPFGSPWLYVLYHKVVMVNKVTFWVLWVVLANCQI